uniref:Uncharacterized protein n=1 Tax=Knipowitschia caucasica TaxID=637954 RepID=A0AAV2J895_KNICA
MQSFQLMSKRPSSPLDNAIPTINVDQIQPLINFWRTVQTAGFSEHEVRTHMSQLFMDIIMNFSDQILSGVGKIIAREQLSSSDAVLSEDAVKDALSAVLRTSFKTSSADEYYALEKAHEQISAEVTDTVNSVLSRVGSPGSKLTVDKEQGYTPSRYKLLSIVSNAQKFMQCCWPCRTKISGEEKPVDKELQERPNVSKSEMNSDGTGWEWPNLWRLQTCLRTVPLGFRVLFQRSNPDPTLQPVRHKKHKWRVSLQKLSRRQPNRPLTALVMKELLDEAAVTVARSSSLNKDEAEVLVSRLSDKSEADAVSIYSMMLDEMDEIRYRNSLDSDEARSVVWKNTVVLVGVPLLQQRE